jgi:hypothetical protein
MGNSFGKLDIFPSSGESGEASTELSPIRTNINYTYLWTRYIT